MKKNKKAVSLVIVMWIVLLTSFLALAIMVIIIPFSKSVSWMEHSTKAYYLANSWIERWIYNIKQEEEKDNYNFNVSKEGLNSPPWQRFFTKTTIKKTWSVEPEIWKWDSDFDKDFNTISTWNPIQFWWWAKPEKIIFKIPATLWDWASYFLENPNECYISWQIWYNDNGEFVTETSDKENCIKWENINWKNKITIDYFTNWKDASESILKFSVIDELKWKVGIKKVVFPYLEWKASWTDFNLRYATVDSTWKSADYVKRLNAKVPRDTVNEAFDFAVFQ